MLWFAIDSSRKDEFLNGPEYLMVLLVIQVIANLNLPDESQGKIVEVD